MASTMPDSRRAAPVLKADLKAKTDLRKPELIDYRPVLGAALCAARKTCGWSLKEFAGKLPLADGGDRDERQVARWEDGSERAHWDVLFACLPLQHALIVELAQVIGDGVEIETVVRVRRYR